MGNAGHGGGGGREGQQHQQQQQHHSIFFGILFCLGWFSSLLRLIYHVKLMLGLWGIFVVVVAVVAVGDNKKESCWLVGLSGVR